MPSSLARWTVCALGAWLGLASPAAARPPFTYALGSVRVLGGDPVQDLSRFLYRTSFGPGCQPLVYWIPAPALAASLHGDAPPVLEFAVAACSVWQKPPSFECSLSAGEVTVRSAPGFRGWRLTLRLPLPARTGAYPVRWHCQIANHAIGSPEATLYLTYAPPLKVVEAPQRTWYERACAWGAGLAAGASESEVLGRLLSGLYAYGQRNWRYGYCTISPDDTTCTFGATKIPLPDSNLDCDYDANQRICWAPWTTLVQGNPMYNFSDCFRFSDAFRFISATQGVGGILRYVPTGEFQQGFSTRPDLRSFDSAFPGNLWCNDRSSLPCAYIFRNHDLAYRPREPYLDATFGRSYASLDQLIGQNVVHWGDPIELPKQRCALLVQRDGYGGFNFYRETEPCPPPRERAVPLSSAGPRLPARSARFGPAEKIQAQVVQDAGSGATALRITAPVLVEVAGPFFFSGRLSKGGRTLAYAGEPRALGREDREVTLDFSINQHFDPRESGPVDVTLGLDQPAPLSYVDSVWMTVTPAASHRPPK